MTKIEIIFKDNTPKECFEGDFEEYYCTNNMFYIKCSSGNVYYFSLDNILRINIFENLDKEKISQKMETQSIPYLMHKEMDVPISDCQKAYEIAMEYLKNQSKIKG